MTEEKYNNINIIIYCQTKQNSIIGVSKQKLQLFLTNNLLIAVLFVVEYCDTILTKQNTFVQIMKILCKLHMKTNTNERDNWG